MTMALGYTRKSNDIRDRREYRLYFALAYPVFFVGTLIGRIAMVGRRRGNGRQSVFSETAQAVSSIMPWVFMTR